MSGPETSGGLERRYRRLLAWYPCDHRADHAEEMLGVLMAAAHQEQTRPGAGESVNLLAGAARIRLRRAAAFFGGPCWRDALAVVSVLAPVLLLAWSMKATIPEFMRELLVWHGLGAIHWARGEMSFLAGSLAVAALVLLRWRRAATVAAMATVAGQVLVFVARVHTGWWFAGAPYTPVQMFLGVLTLAGLLCSDGPQRGLEVLGRWRSGLIIGGVLALAAADALWVGYFPGSRHVVSRPILFVLIGVAVPVAVVALAARSPLGRRVILLAAPAMSPGVVYLLARLLVGTDSVGPGSLMWALYLVLAIVVAALAVVLRSVPGGPVAAEPVA